jgi:hypothetical protein
MDHDILMFAQVMTIIIASIAALVVVGLGGRVLWRMGSRVSPTSARLPDETRHQRLETAVDSIAIEVERISEAQRFMVTLLHDSLPARRGELPLRGSSGRVDTPH